MRERQTDGAARDASALVVAQVLLLHAQHARVHLGVERRERAHLEADRGYLVACGKARPVGVEGDHPGRATAVRVQSSRTCVELMNLNRHAIETPLQTCKFVSLGNM